VIAFIVALKREAQSTINNLECLKTSKIAGKEVFSGRLFNKDCVLIISGIGKVNASLSTQILIDKFSPDVIVNFGTCGGVDSSVQAKKYYLADSVCQFDFDLRDLDGVPLGYIQDYETNFFPSLTYRFEIDLEKRKLATADRFTESDIDANDIRELGCSLRDMEGGAIAQVCHANCVKLITIKGVTDVKGNGLTAEQFISNLNEVSQNFPTVLEKILNNL
jgi:adenosylhomocysteine nucleosidase